MTDHDAMPTPYPDSTYTTPHGIADPFSIFFPNLGFYWRMCATLKKASDLARRGKYGDADWVRSSIAIRDALEKCEGKFIIEGLDNIRKTEGPCVFVGNHMSTLETFILPGVIQPIKPVCFVVKESLLTYPVFSHVMRSRNPVVVQRKDPRADFAAVMEGGMERLHRGISMIVFPQSTRRLTIDRQHFNSMGVKLARKAGVPLMPLALRTDAWGMGGLFGLLKDHGPITPRIPVHIRFGEALTVRGNGKEEHEQVYRFIENALAEWGLRADSQAADG